MHVSQHGGNLTLGMGSYPFYGLMDDVQIFDHALSQPEVADLTTVHNLKITKQVEPIVTNRGNSITYTLAFNNLGNVVATGVVITDYTPVSVTNPAIVGNSGAAITLTGSAPNFSWEVQNLAPGAGGVITLAGAISTALPLGSQVENTAFISASLPNDFPQDSQSTATVQVLFRVEAVQPDQQALNAPLTTTIAAAFNDTRSWRYHVYRC